MCICLSHGCFLYFPSPKSKVLQWVRKEDEISSWAPSWVFQEKVCNWRRSCRPSFQLRWALPTCSLHISTGCARGACWELPKSLGNTKTAGVFGLMSGCTGIDNFWSTVVGPIDFLWPEKMSVSIICIFFSLFAFYRACSTVQKSWRNTSEKLQAKCQHLSVAARYCGNGLIP